MRPCLVSGTAKAGGGFGGAASAGAAEQPRPEANDVHHSPCPRSSTVQLSAPAPSYHSSYPQPSRRLAESFPSAAAPTRNRHGCSPPAPPALRRLDRVRRARRPAPGPAHLPPRLLRRLRLRRLPRLAARLVLLAVLARCPRPCRTQGEGQSQGLAPGQLREHNRYVGRELPGLRFHHAVIYAWE